MKRPFDRSKAAAAAQALTLSSVIALTACGGGGGGGGVAAVTPPGGGDGGGGAGIGGTGFAGSGTIDGTGSIFVNGIRFDVDDADITVGGQPATEDDLGLGMVVRVRGRVDADGAPCEVVLDGRTLPSGVVPIALDVSAP